MPLPSESFVRLTALYGPIYIRINDIAVIRASDTETARAQVFLLNREAPFNVLETPDVIASLINCPE